MATREEVDAALHGLVARLDAVDPEVRSRHTLSRTVSCAVRDLDVVYTAHLGDEGLSGVTTEQAGPAQVRLRVDSDDLLSLIEGRLALPAAWASGRLRVDASVFDLLKLRNLL